VSQKRSTSLDQQSREELHWKTDWIRVRDAIFYRVCTVSHGFSGHHSPDLAPQNKELPALADVANAHARLVQELKEELHHALNLQSQRNKV
jgi:hypothetical protein